MPMLDLETRKKNTKLVVNSIKNTLYHINPNHRINGLIVLIIHWIAVGIPLLAIFIFKTGWKFYLSAVIWIIICILHLYFNGCICTKTERELWNTKDWYGPWIFPFTILEKIGIPITPRLSNNIFICWGILIIIWIIIRMLFNY